MTTFFQLTDLGLIGSPTQLLQQWLSYMQSVYPGYTPSQSNLEYIQAVIFASWASDVAQQCSLGATDLFKTYGETLFQVMPENGSSATAVVQVTAVDTEGYVLSAGTQFILDTVGFATFNDAQIPAGSSSIQVTVAALTPGTLANGAGSSSGAQINQQIDWVSSVSLVSAAAGGVDAEDDDAYLTRLTNLIQLMAPRPITASDYSTFVLNFAPVSGTDQQEVGRATALDGYDPYDPSGPQPGWSLLANNTGTFGNEREVTIGVTDATGNALNDDTLVAVQAWLETVREANFIINVVSPTYSPIYIQATVKSNGLYSPSAVQTNIQSALMNLLNPQNWGLPENSATGWNNTTTVYQSVVEAVVQGAGGVEYILDGTLGIGFAPSPNGTSDLVLPGPVSLPTTVDGTTIPPSAFNVVV